MGFFDIFKIKPSNPNTFNQSAYEKKNQKIIDKFNKTYDLNTIDGILNITVPKTKETKEPFSPVSVPENILKKKATEYKKNKQMDLAIACLRKANEFMDVSWFTYSYEDYYRLVKYLKLDRQFDNARKEEALLDEKFPSIEDDENSSENFNSLINHLKKSHEDLFEFVGAYDDCPLCSMYSGIVYSISGKSKYFPSMSELPENLKMDYCPECGGYLSFYPFYDIVPEEHDKKVKISQRPIKDRRTKEQKREYEEGKKEALQRVIDEDEYDYLYEFMPDICPKSLSGYRRMKKSNSTNFQKLYKKAKEAGYEIKFVE